jgi:hypothetical protein
MALPWIVLLLCVVYDCVPGDHIFPDSISATYYFAPTVTPFMIILGASGILLMCYRGYTWVDDLVNILTGICALGVCLFPCYNGAFEKVGTFQLDPHLSGNIHNISAAMFFLLLAYNVLCLFTKSSGEMTRNKKIRNIAIIICVTDTLNYSLRQNRSFSASRTCRHKKRRASFSYCSFLRFCILQSLTSSIL